jgi:solute:Na+ symporter, SSS family
LEFLDWFVVGLYFLLMVAIGAWSYKQIHSTQDFFAAGGKMPWWLAGISHHVSGYSAVVFTAFAAVAYTYGFTIYVWWAMTIVVSMVVAAIFIAPRWARLRKRFNVESPTEYLKTRYNLPTQQILAWSGCLLKIFDVGAKYAAMAIILNVIAGTPLVAGVLITGAVSLIYVTIGGLWADALNDTAQFIVQLLAAIVMIVAVLAQLGGVGAIFSIWDRLPEGHAAPFAGDYTPVFVLFYLFIVFLSYSGGQWNLAQRFIASPMGSDARKAALFSGALYLIFPLIFFFPMWAAPILFPDISDPEQVYGIVATELLPAGMLGLVLASMFAATMSMTASDSNVVSSIVTRDIFPVISSAFRAMSRGRALWVARITTFTFTALTLIVAIENQYFGGVIGLIVTWFAGLLGPTAIPMILGLLPAFKHSDATAAIVSWSAGVVTFFVAYYVFEGGIVATTCVPAIVSAILFIGIGWLNYRKTVASEVANMLDVISREDGTAQQLGTAAVASEQQ